MNYGTFTQTYTVVDIRKAFENFEADLRMIARRTGKWTDAYVDKVFHDLIKYAEAKYLTKAIIYLKGGADTTHRATVYTVNEAGTSITGDRAGGNDWPNLPGTELVVYLEFTGSWRNLTDGQRQSFLQSDPLQINWSPSNLNTNFPGLTKENAQTYSSNGYEVKKENYK